MATQDGSGSGAFVIEEAWQLSSRRQSDPPKTLMKSKSITMMNASPTTMEDEFNHLRSIIINFLIALFLQNHSISKIPFLSISLP